MTTYELDDTHSGKLQKQLITIICKNRVLGTSDYCLHNQLKFHNSIEFIIELVN